MTGDPASPERERLVRALRTLSALAVAMLTTFARGQMPDPPGQVQRGAVPKHEAYLFAHMMHNDYWRLYYEQYPGVAYG